MERKRLRDSAEDEEASPADKRARLEALASAADSSSVSLLAAAALNQAQKAQNAQNAQAQTQSAAEVAGELGNGGSHSLYSNASSNGSGNGLVNGGNGLGSLGNGLGNGVGSGPGPDLDPGPGSNSGHPPGTAPIESMSDITRYFKHAVFGGWDRRAPTYEEVHVLMIYWDEDGDDIKAAVTQLEDVFRHSYRYRTDMYAIASIHGYKEALYAKIDAFFATKNSLGCLSILYYAGHLAANPFGVAPEWRPRRKGTATYPVDSKPIQTAIEGAACDVLLLLDFCDARHHPSSKAGAGTARRNVIEVLETRSTGNSTGRGTGFTRALAEELAAAAASSTPIDTNTLREKVANRMTVVPPRGRGRPPKDTRGVNLDVAYLPTHYWLFQKRSIELVPLPEEPQVVLCLRVLGGIEDVSQWGKWIFHAPAHARDAVHIDGLHSGFSTMVVLRVPVTKWPFFAECPAGSFVAYTTIGDIAPDVLERIDSQLAPKLWQENEPSAAAAQTANVTSGPAPVADMTVTDRDTETDVLNAGGAKKAPFPTDHDPMDYDDTAAYAGLASPANTNYGDETPTQTSAQTLTPTLSHTTASALTPTPASALAATSSAARMGAPTGLDAHATNSPNAQNNGSKRPRKALPTERKALPSGSDSSPPLSTHRRELPTSAGGGSARGSLGPRGSRDYDQQRQSHVPLEPGHSDSNGGQQQQDMDKDAALAAAAQKPFKISIKVAGQVHTCHECKAGFKDAESLHNHVRKQHTRPFHCVFNWAGCESTFASKNEWKRHVMSQHILLQYWVCRVDMCSKVVNKTNTAAGGSNGTGGLTLPNGAIFNRKDLFTQHLRRMHTPAMVKKLQKQAKQGAKIPNHETIVEWENRLKELQLEGVQPRCRLPIYMLCPAKDCGIDFQGDTAWDDRMEHVARHLDAAASGREAPVVFGGKTDPTLTNWATRPEVGIAKRIGPNAWRLDNPLRPEIMAWTASDNLPDRETPEPGGRDSSTGVSVGVGVGGGDDRDKENQHRHDDDDDNVTGDSEYDSTEQSMSVIEVADGQRRRRSSGQNDHHAEARTRRHGEGGGSGFVSVN